MLILLVCCRVFKTARDDKVEPGKIGLSGVQRRVRTYWCSTFTFMHLGKIASMMIYKNSDIKL